MGAQSCYFKGREATGIQKLPYMKTPALGNEHISSARVWLS